MATIAGVCIAYGSPAVFATLHGPSSSTDSADFPPFDQAGKFRHHDMLRTGFPALSVCFEQQDRLCKQWMPTVAAALVRLLSFVTRVLSS